MSETTLTAEKVKHFAVEAGQVDLVGIGNIERWEGAPRDMDPRTIMPRARSVVVFVKRILRGCYRGIDEGTHWPSYTAFGYAGLGRMLGKANYKLCRYIEDHGYEAAPMSPVATTRECGPRGPKVAPDKPRREVAIHHRIAAVLAGVGEMGWSKVLLTEELGPRQRIGILLTDAELEPDPVRVGCICDRCKRCVAECPGGAIPKDKSVSLDVEGGTLEWGDLDLGKCKLTHFGLNRRSAPFLIKRFPGLNLPIDQQSVTWLESWDLGWAIFPSVAAYKALTDRGVPALCGARGCIIACMKHLEEKGLVRNTFRTRKVFSEKEPWCLPEKPGELEHHGFVYDPDTDEDILDKFAEKAFTSSTWY